MPLYEPPANSELDVLLGQTLIQVCIGKYQLRLNFTGSLSIAVESSLTVLPASTSGNSSWEPGNPFAVVGIFDLIDREVSACTFLDDGGLQLKFGESDEVRIGVSEGFESYAISGEQGDIFIV